MRRPSPERRPWPPLYPLLFLFLFFRSLSSSAGADNIKPGDVFRDSETLVSAGGNFRLGFFTPGGGKYYLGIWYEKIPKQTVVWVANRETPVANGSGVLRLGKDGNLVLYDGERRVVWSSSPSAPLGASSPIAQLKDTGNLVVKAAEDGDQPENFLWQSFDHPTDTLLPGMKLGWDLNRGVDRYIQSWMSDTDPSTGRHSFRLRIQGSPEMLLTSGQKVVYRSGPWIGVRFSGVPEMKSNDIFTFDFITTPNEVYYTYALRNADVVSRVLVSPSGVLERYVWLKSGEWSRYWWAPKDQCDGYSECGAYGICDSNNSPVCRCVDGFTPRSKAEWELRNGSSGCVRERAPPDCRDSGEGFITMTAMKLPEALKTVMNRGMSLGDCEAACQRDCSCTAYAAADVRTGNGCIIWAGELVDLREYSSAGQELYVRVPASVLVDRRGRPPAGGSDRDKKKTASVPVIVAPTGAVGFLLLGLAGCWAWKKKKEKKKKANKDREEGREELSLSRSKSNRRDDDLELPLFDFGAVAAATDNFSEENKLGEGGFGPVFKGELGEGQGVAVKRLSKKSAQGLNEFRNEVMLIAKLQHRNLVRLLGCCIDGDERILVYEYMHNKGLDSFLFVKSQAALLDWPRRFSIILGIARGLLYLHQDSRFRIIHRDLKASNILLDIEMNPKISDFGAARIFYGEKEDTENTSKVVGTYGYMSPEYAMDGIFSMKSDVFSFGVLVIEIVSGKKNRGFYYSDSCLNLLSLAWKLWNEGNCTELLDETMGPTYSLPETMRCIQVGLLCVQERAEDRPTMSAAVLMLSSATSALPKPKQPGFCMGRSPMHTESSTAHLLEDTSGTVNQVTVTIVQGR